MKTGHVPDIGARQLLAVLAVAENGSFIAAAAELHVSQPGLTRTIKRVEDVLGVRLFERTTRQVRLSDAGCEFVALARCVTNDLRIAGRAMREICGQQSGQVIVASLMSVSHGILPSAISAYRHARPGIDTQIRDGIHSQVLEDVKSGAGDFGDHLSPGHTGRAACDEVGAGSLGSGCEQGIKARPFRGRGHPF